MMAKPEIHLNAAAIQLQKAFLLILFLFFSFCSFAQMDKADKLYQDYKYAQAISLYKPLADSGNIRAVRKIADCYRKINDYEHAEKYYAIAVADKNVIPKNFLYYGQSLMNNGKYEEAKGWLKKYIDSKSEEDNTLAKTLLASCDKAREPEKESRRISIRNLSGINTAAADFCAVPYENGILFTSTRKGKMKGGDGEGFQQVYFASMNADSTYRIEAVKGIVNTKNYNSGPACVDTLRQLLYFTKNNFQYGDAITNKKGDVTLKIFSAKKSNDSWKDIRELELNDNEYSCAFPSINKDGDVLFFSSDRAGGYGGKDIYYSTYIAGKWSRPKNAGKNINTAGDERYPFIHDDGTLYFSSTGLAGYGGMDIYKSVPNKLGEFGRPENLGAPINSSADDFGFYLSADHSSGYLSSNRNGGAGSDDIYRFEFPGIPLELTILGDGRSADSLHISLHKDGQLIADGFYNSMYNTELEPNADYLLNISKEGFTAQEFRLKTEHNKKPVYKTINLNSLKKED